MPGSFHNSSLLVWGPHGPEKGRPGARTLVVCGLQHGSRVSTDDPSPQAAQPAPTQTISGPCPWASAGLANGFHLLGKVFLELRLGSEGPLSGGT